MPVRGDVNEITSRKDDVIIECVLKDAEGLAVALMGHVAGSLRAARWKCGRRVDESGRMTSI